MASIQYRLAVVEAKLGIETPKAQIGIFWDDEEGASLVGQLADEADGRFVCVYGGSWDYFIPFTDDELARFKAAGITFDSDE